MDECPFQQLNCMWSSHAYRLDHWNSTSKVRGVPSRLVSGCNVYWPLMVPCITTVSIWIVTFPSEPCNDHRRWTNLIFHFLRTRDIDGFRILAEKITPLKVKSKLVPILSLDCWGTLVSRCQEEMKSMQRSKTRDSICWNLPCRRHPCFCKQCGAFGLWVDYQTPKQNPASIVEIRFDLLPAPI